MSLVLVVATTTKYVPPVARTTNHDGREESVYSTEIHEVVGGIRSFY